MRWNIFLPRRRGGGKKRATLRALEWLGPTWRAAPLRRGIQALSLLVFLHLFFIVCWPYGSEHHADGMDSREWIEAEAFLALDPLVSISTSIAARTWVWSLTWAGAILLVCLAFPRGFCGYICPLGTLIDIFDWIVKGRRKRLRGPARGWWVHLKYYVLVGVLSASLFGVLLAGFVAALPVVTRGLLFLLAPLQMGLARGWYLIPPMNAGHFLSLGLFFAVFGLGLLAPRFWCRYVCPTGAVFSLGNLLRVGSRKVQASCIDCGKCVEACPFDAIQPDYSTRFADCTFCQTCGGVCPTEAIIFETRWGDPGRSTEPAEEGGPVPLSRRGFILGAFGGGLTALGVRELAGARLEAAETIPLVRPPGSVPERDFLRLCIRCGECFKACPFHVLQPAGWQQGIEGLWAPRVVADWSGCDPTCANCGQVCPTGAIRALPLEEKRVARMGLAVVNEVTCLPFSGREACQLCVDECSAAGYDAMEFIRVRVDIDDDGRPVEGSGHLAPVVLAERCVGCGLCQARCHAILVKERRLLESAAIHVEAGPGKEDRIARGSYRALREAEERHRGTRQEEGGGDYLPDFLK